MALGCGITAEDVDGGEVGKTESARPGVVLEAQRRLSHAALNPALDRFTTRVKKAYSKMQQLYTQHDDYGATYDHNITRAAKHEPAYRDSYFIMKSNIWSQKPEYRARCDERRIPLPRHAGALISAHRGRTPTPSSGLQYPSIAAA